MRGVGWWLLVVVTVSLSLALGRAGAQVLMIVFQPEVQRLGQWLHGGG